MSAFEALRMLRNYIARQRDQTIEELVQTIQRVESDVERLDFDAALQLQEIVDTEADFTSGDFYKSCISATILSHQPIWARTITLGRRRFIKKLSRDQASIFREAGLLEDPPSEELVDWWDYHQSEVRFTGSNVKHKRGRRAEQLSLEKERIYLESIGSRHKAQWIAIEDNTAGYDVLSYRPGEYDLEAMLIEVKSTIVSPLRFYLTRNEWNRASKAGDAYVVHVWDLDKEPPELHELKVAELEPHIPADNGKGRWDNTVIPVNLN